LGLEYWSYERADRPRRWVSIVLVLSLLLAYSGFILSRPDAAVAAPTLKVTKSISGRPLLGGQATVQITVQNTGDAKGYNLSLTDVFGSSRPDPQGRVAFVSAADGGGALAPTTMSTSGVTGDTTLSFVNIRDLAPNESCAFSIVVTIDPAKTGDATWAINDLLTDTATANVNTMPDGSGTTIAGTASASAKVLPIVIDKTTDQTTGVAQATGTLSRPYTYTLTVQNNYVNPTASVVVTDTLPDGVEYLGMVSGPSPDTTPGHDATTGVTPIKWTLGAFTPGQQRVLKIQVGIRYDYYGSADGGVHRAHDATAGPLGTPIPDKLTLVNTSGLTGSYGATSTPVADAASSTVTAAYFTGQKSGSPSTGVPGTVVSYSLTAYASQYYDAMDTTGSVIVHDTLPDGQTYDAGSASLPPYQVTHDPATGLTDIYWRVAGVPHSGQYAITFTATVDGTWEGAPLTGQPVRAGDAMSNSVDFTAIWDDLVDVTRPDNKTISTSAAASASLSTPLPKVRKDVWDPMSATWSKSATATVGDVLHFRVQFNADGATKPARNDIDMGNVQLNDWLPPGMSYVAGSAVATYSATGDFSVPASGSPPPLNISTPTAMSLNGLGGIGWYLGDVAPAGWWEAEFDVHVDNLPAIASGGSGNNYWKFTGTNSRGSNYSDRDIVAIAYIEPTLTISKNTTSTVFLPSQPITYTVTVNNAGAGFARDLLLTDQQPAGMRNAAPSVAGVTVGGVSVTNPGHWLSSYNSGTGLFTVDFNDTAGSVNTSLPAGQSMVVTLVSTPDATAGAGTALLNTATMAYGSSDATSGRPYAPVSGNRTVTLQSLTATKTVSPGTVTIGQTMDCTITVTVPAYSRAYWPRIDDSLDRYGFRYVAGSATLTDVSGAPAVPAAFTSGNSTPVETELAGPARDLLQWNLMGPAQGNDFIDNTNSAVPYKFSLSFKVKATGLRYDNVTNLFLPPALQAAAHDRVIDTGTAYWNTVDAAARPGAPNKNGATNTQTVNIDQPWLVATKTVLSAGTFGGGSPVDYRLTYENRGYSSAQDVTITDGLALGMRTTTPQVLSVKVNGVPVALGTGYLLSPAYNPSNGVLTVDLHDLLASVDTPVPANQTVTVDVRAWTDATVVAGDSLLDATRASFNTLADGSGRVFPAPPSLPASGGATAVTPITSPTISKTIVSGSPATIGDVVRYRLRSTVPTATVLRDAELLDTVAADGMAYVPGSAFISPVSGAPTTSATLFGDGVFDPSGAGSKLRFYLHPNPGSADIDNSNPAVGPYVFDVVYDMRVTGLADSGLWVWSPTVANTSSNSAVLQWQPLSGPRSIGTGAVSTPIVQPWLRTTKSFNVPTAEGGDTVTATVVVKNIGSSPAYASDAGPSFVDTLPVGLSNIQLVSVTHSTRGVLSSPADYMSTVTGSTLKVTYSQPATDSTVLQPGESLTFVYRTSVDPIIGTAAQLTNRADANWSSEWGSVAGEREYVDADPLDPPDDTASAVLNVPAATLVKTSGAPSGKGTIGQSFPYTIVAAVPPNTTMYAASVSDFVPDGLTVSGGSTQPAVGTLTIGAKLADGRTPVAWSMGDVANPPSAAVTLTLNVKVDDAFHTGAKLKGVAPQDTLTNSASLSWLDAPSGGSPHSAASAPVVMTVVEPRLTIAKSANVTTAWAGQTITYTVDVANTGTSAAFGARWADLIPAKLFSAGTSPVLVSATIGGTPLVDLVDANIVFGSNPVSVDTSIPGGASIPGGSSLHLVYRVIVQGGAAGALTNGAQIQSYSSLPGAGRSYVGPTAAATVTGLVPALTLTKVRLGDSFVQTGQPVPYRVTVTNSGGAPATSFTVTDLLDDPAFAYVTGSTTVVWPPASASVADPVVTGKLLTWLLPGATLMPGQSMQFDFQVTPGAGSILASHTDTAAASAFDLGGFPYAAAPRAAQVTVTDPRLAVSKILHAGQSSVVASGGPVAYDIGVTNTGDTAMTTVGLTDAFDGARLTPFAASPAANTTAAALLTWTDITGAGSLAPGVTTTITVTFRTKAAGSPVTDVATVTGTDANADPAPPATSSSSVLSVTNPHVLVRKVLHPGQDPIVSGGAAAGSHNLGYDLVVTNDGDTALATIPVADTWPAGQYTFDGAVPAALPVTVGASSLYFPNVAPTGGLAPGQSTTVTVCFIAPVTPPHSPATNSVEVTKAVDAHGDPAPASNDTNAQITITYPHVSIAKALTLGQNPHVQIGGLVSYDITLTNDGNTTLSAVPLTDTYDYGFLTPVSATPGWDVGVPGSLTWLDATGGSPLVPGASTTVRVVFRVFAPLSPILDTAASTGAVDVNGDSPVGTVTATDSSLTGTNPGLTITKTLAPTQDPWIQPGDPVVWLFTFTNSGDTAITSVPMHDTLDTAIGTLSFAGSSGTLGWTISGALSGPSTVDMTATGILGPGLTATRTVTITPGSAAPPGVHTNDVTTPGGIDIYGGVTAPSSSSATVMVTDPHLSVRKVLHVGQASIVASGGPVTYDIGVTNDGDTVVPAVPLADTFDAARLRFDSATPSGPDSQGSGVLRWTDITGGSGLAPAVTTTVTVTFTTTAAGTSVADTAGSSGALDVHGDLIPPASASDSALTITNPHLRVAKTLHAGQDAVVPEGGLVTYDITLTNDGDTALASAPLADTYDGSRLEYFGASLLPDVPLPAGTVAWTDALAGVPLLVGDARTIQVAFKVTAPGAGVLDIANVSGALDVNGDPAPDASASDSTLLATRPRVAIVKQPAAGQKSIVASGGVVAYDIGVTNDGDTVLTTVPLRDDFDALHLTPLSPASPPWDSASASSLVWNDVTGSGDLVPGQTTTVTVTFTTTSSGTSVPDTATVSGAADVNGDTPADATASDRTLTITNPFLSIDKRLHAGQEPLVAVGDLVTYDIVVTNTGDTAMASVAMQDVMPFGLGLVSSTPTATAYVPSTAAWDDILLGSPLAPGASRTVTAVMRATDPGAVLPNEAIAAGTDVNGDPAPIVAGWNTLVGAYAAGSITCTKTSEPAAGTVMLPGQEITYTVTAANGSPATVPGASIVDTLPASVSFVPGTATFDGVPVPDATVYDPATRIIRYDLGDFGPAATGALRFRVKVGPEDISRKGIMNEATFADTTRPLASSEMLFHPVDPFDILKVGVDVNGGQLRTGDVIEWRITITNTGLVPTTHVVVNDTVPAETTYVPGSITGRGADASAAPSLTWLLGTMPVGESVTLTFQSRVKAGLKNDTPIRNQAVVTSDDSLPKLSTDPATHNVNDPTVLFVRTSGDELPAALGGVLALLAIAALWFVWRRPRRRLQGGARA
jgi:uncharacterized repeat protein (TIGR01451 family)/fimbrial isopeptide formation D2 family protein